MNLSPSCGNTARRHRDLSSSLINACPNSKVGFSTMRFMTFAIALLSFSLLARAAGWTSPDGKLSFNLPTDGSLIEVKSPPVPAVAMWNTADGTSRLVFIAQANPNNTPLNQAGLEQGSLNQLSGGTLLSSTQTQLAGVPAYTIAVTGPQKIYIQQTVLAFSGTFYKVMAAGPKRISDDPHFAGVFKTITVLDTSPAVPGSQALAEHELSVKMAAGAFFILIVASVIYAVRRQSKPPGAS